MTQKTIKAIYQKPVTYKLIRDGYKTVTDSFTPDDNTPSIMNLATPSEVYSSNLQYTVDTSLDGEPILNFDSFISPDNETVESAQYCYAPKGRDYNYTIWNPEATIYDNFNATGNPSISDDGIFTNLNHSNCLITKTNFAPGNYSWEVQTKVKIGNDVTSELAIFDNPVDQRSFRIGLAGTVRDRWQLLVSNGSSWITTSQHYGSYAVIANTVYWIKAGFDGINTYYLDYSLDGEHYTRDVQYTSTVKIQQDLPVYMKGTAATYVDLSCTCIKIDNVNWWTPYRIDGRWEDAQIPGMLDESVTTDNWNQSQNYKLYQLKQQDNSSNLQLTSNSITNEGQKYNQYIDQITIPARDYKWYYHNVSTKLYDNYDIIGSPNVNPNTGVISGFSTTDYITITKGFSTALPYKIIVKFTISSSFPQYCRIIAGAGGDYSIIPFYFNYANLGAYGSSNGSSWNMFSHHHIADLSTNTTYTMMFEFTGSAYIWYQKVNGTWIELTRITSNEVTVSPSGFDIGRCDGSSSWSGSIDLSEYTIEVNGNIFWSPISNEDKWIANKSIYDYSVTGLYADTLDFTKSYIGVNNSEYHKYLNPDVCLMPINGGETIEGKNQYLIPKVVKTLNGNSFGDIVFDDDTGIVSGFSSTTGITLPEAFPSTVSNFDMIFKGSISNFDDDNVLLGYANTDEGYIGVTSRDTHSFSYWFGSWTQGQTTINFNTYYWFRVIYNGSSTKGYILLDNGYNLDNLPSLSQWSEEWTLDNNKFNGRLLNLGYNFATTSEHWTGNIDLDNSVIRINGSNWWTGIKYNSDVIKVGNANFNGATSNFRSISGCLYNYRDDGQQHNFDVYYDSNYTQPILVGSGEIYSQGTKVDTITIPEHKLWTYENGGVWTERGYEPESSGESQFVEESYTPTPTPAVVIPEITLGYNVIVNLTGTTSCFEEFTIDGDTYTLSDFVNNTLRITLAANQTYAWSATAQPTYTVSPSNGSFLLDDDVTINIQCQPQQYFITPGDEPTE